MNGRCSLSGSLNTFSNLDSSNRFSILTLRQASFDRLPSTGSGRGRTEQGEWIEKQTSGRASGLERPGMPLP
ncbi:MAG: hypothetical protein LBD67_11050 [Candidatus Accumulibacter sp.]|nr:hypothetical protein [Accumulibacter sp.]